MKLIISNVNADNKYKGAYARIFHILNKDRIFSPVYETEDSIGLVGSNYFLTLSESPDDQELTKILKIRNVSLSTN